MTSKPKRIRVRFAVEDDYAATRDLDEGSPNTRLRWAVSRLAGQAHLTERERDILDRVLQGSSNREISEALEISKATVKWHMHNIFTKTGATTREALLREALQLGRSGPEPEGDDDDG
jgi:ATP/maltotriose-dependent transcriptional regulator MalT